MTIKITRGVCGKRYSWTLFGHAGQLVCMGVNNLTGDNGFASKATAEKSAARFIDLYIHETLRVVITDWNGKILGGQNSY